MLVLAARQSLQMVDFLAVAQAVPPAFLTLGDFRHRLLGEDMGDQLIALSNELSGAVERAGQAVVAVNARARFSSSGVHWQPNVVVTADHAIKREAEIRIALPHGVTMPAVLAGRDPGTDLAVLKVEGLEMPVAGAAADEPLNAGNLILAVGRSEQTGVMATLGVISAAAGPWRSWRGGLIDRFLRLDLALYPGASGSALVSARGAVVGIATSGLARVAALGVPVSTVNRVVDELLAKGRISRGYLGVGLHPVALPDHLTRQAQVAEGGGLLVLSVEPAGPAEQAGLLVGDVLLALDGKRLRDTDDVQSALEVDSVGRQAPALLLRGGVPKQLAITVGERPRRRD